VRSPYLPEWLEAGVAEWDQRPVIWVSASSRVAGTLASSSAQMSVAAKLRAIASAARGAHVLHEHGQLHGAICPQAVALIASPPAGQPPGPWTGSAITDQTLGRAILAPPTLATGARPVAQIGYPPLGYLDPQLLRGEGGRWSDIWALGATTRQVVTGSPPFPGIEDLPVVHALAQLLAVPAPAPVELPPAVAGIVGACLAPDPASRPSTAAEVADRLEEAAAKW
jgi:serine/threonine protein kinase